jgi:hypothetical protein
MTRELYHPVLDCFLRGIPNLYRSVNAPAGTAILIEISGDCGGKWFLEKRNESWAFAPASTSWTARVVIPQELAWRMFTKGISRETARAQVTIEGVTLEGVTLEGVQDLGEKIFHFTAIVG